MRIPLFLAAAFALLGASSFGASSAPASTLRVATPLLPIYLGNPYGATALPMALPAHAIYDPLTAPGPAGAARPWLADSWAQSDPSTWIFKLKPGVVYSNGERLTATSIVAGLEYLMTPQGGRDALNSLDVGAAIAKVEAVDALSVRIVTRAVDPILPTHLSFFRPPAPAAWAELIKAGDNVAATRHPVGTGPFKVESWETSRIVLRAHAASWRAPKVDGLEIIVIPDPVARTQALLSGAVDIAVGLPPSDRLQLEAAGLRLVARNVPVASYVLFVTVAFSTWFIKRMRLAD